MGMTDYKRFLSAIHSPENANRATYPVIKMSKEASLLFPGNLRACLFVMKWLFSGGIAGQREDGKDELVQFNPALKADADFANGFCFNQGLAALRASQGKTGDIVEDFASIPMPSLVARLPSPNAAWKGTRLAYFQGPQSIDSQENRDGERF